MRSFNTAGPVDCGRHYCIPPLERLDLDLVLLLIEQHKCFVLHAPRQTGKTSCLLALPEHLNAVARYRALYANVEVGQSARENVQEAMHAILGEIAASARDFLQDPFLMRRFADGQAYGAHGVLGGLLSEWAASSPKPIVLLLDEVDSLVCDTLISLLRQLRAGYPKRPAYFPQSVVLCGVRDVRDYRIQSGQERAMITGGSAFNVKAESLRVGDFTRDEVERLYAQHTAETGQALLPDALDVAWDLSFGQPWVANALGYEVCSRIPEGRDRSQPITSTLVLQAKGNLILRRETHLDQLADKLKEPRVRRVIEPLLEGDVNPEQIPQDDIAYVRDLGLIRTEGQLRIANGIYQEVIPRELTYGTQVTIAQEPAWYIRPDGRVDMPTLLAAFQEFFREHSEQRRVGRAGDAASDAAGVERFDYKEAGPQLLMQAFLQRIVNGGGRVEREYGLGRKRTDLLVVWDVAPTGETQKVVIELKVLHKSLAATMAEGLEQTAAYMDRCAASEGHLVIFDRTPGKLWEEKLFRRDETHAGRQITVWGM